MSKNFNFVKSLTMGVAFVVGLALLSSCSDDAIKGEGNIVIPAETSLQNLYDYGYSIDLPLTTNTNWTVECEGDWFYTFPEKGTKDDKTIKLCLLDNMEGEARTGKLIVHFEKGKDKTFDLRQLGMTKENEDGIITPSKGYRRYAVGYGYDYFDRAANPSSVKKNQVFKVAAMLADGVLLSDNSVIKIGESCITGSSTSEISNELQVKAGIEASYLGFTGELKGSFGNNYSKNTCTEYAIVSTDVIKTKWYLESSLPVLISDYLTKPADDAINGKSKYYQGDTGIAHLVTEFGTHAVVEAVLGGKCSVGITIERDQIEDEYNIEAYAKAAYKNVVVDASIEVEEKYKNSYKANSSKCKTTISAVGGDGMSTEEFKSKGGLQKWQESLKDESKCALMKFTDNSLIPIWELCEDPVRAKAIKDYILNVYYKGIDMGEVKAAYKIEIPEWDDTDFKATQVKHVETDETGVIVAEICHEYIPQLNGKTRVTTIYPVINGKPRYDAGIYVGDKNTYPSQIQWKTQEVGETWFNEDQIKEMPQEKLAAVYLEGMHFTTNPTSAVIQNTKNVDEYFEARGRDWTKETPTTIEKYKYPIVKVGFNIWTRENLSTTKDFQETTILSNKTGSFSNIESYYSLIIKGINTTYYNPYRYWETEDLNFSNWCVPSKLDGDNFVNYLSKDARVIMLDDNNATGMNVQRFDRINVKASSSSYSHYIDYNMDTFDGVFFLGATTSGTSGRTRFMIVADRNSNSLRNGSNTFKFTEYLIPVRVIRKSSFRYY